MTKGRGYQASGGRMQTSLRWATSQLLVGVALFARFGVEPSRRLDAPQSCPPVPRSPASQ